MGQSLLCGSVYELFLEIHEISTISFDHFLRIVPYSQPEKSFFSKLNLVFLINGDGVRGVIDSLDEYCSESLAHTIILSTSILLLILIVFIKWNGIYYLKTECVCF